MIHNDQIIKKMKTSLNVNKKHNTLQYLMVLLIILCFSILGCLDKIEQKEKVEDVRITYRDDICKSNIRRILFALKQYHDEYGTFPSPIIVSDNGLQHSWRSAILPYLEIEDYRMNEPWNSPWNTKLYQKVSKIFRCPHENKENNYSTSYLMVTLNILSSNVEKEKEIIDKSSILIIEAYNTGIPIGAPCDIPLKQVLKGPRQCDNKDQDIVIGGVHKPPDGDRQCGCFFIGDKDGKIRMLTPNSTIEEIFQFKTDLSLEKLNHLLEK
jgi:hypothetical protein